MRFLTLDDIIGECQVKIWCLLETLSEYQVKKTHKSKQNYPQESRL